MTDTGTPKPAGNRWGRYALSAAVLVLSLTGVTALVKGGQDQPRRIPLAAAASAPETALPAAGNGELTSGPLMSTSKPTRVVIPALDVDVPLTGLGRQADGTMQVPTDARTVGWYTGAPTPGSLGPAVLAGHVDYRKQPGTFHRLTDLKPGDSIDVDREDGSVAMFAVVKVERYAKAEFPTDAVYGAINRAGLRLITCGGDFDSTAGHYEDNIVVYADLTMAHPAG
ncbi:peptidase C60 sortase A and B [Actinoplanes sp. SE50]|uniref:class F sortase n=1 Tax=unclassified Actinoplanes TaxID=2626549 RepID=UPI00023ED068|nr:MULTISPECIES: class F sortase [unclassified Actinoplanes]AEV84370.1 peptidase C60 sortase A and B [Actinoplanes sp. SE50/110]ATO82762.1 peptidase C60 sortase A and B [Actinoplanes sp. SE50]SLM00169.1 Sortase (surface protein transpeptidase) [Actinoplanes sp. SE50/110]